MSDLKQVAKAPEVKATAKPLGVVEAVLPDYTKELTEKQETTLAAVQTCLNDNGIKDEMTRARILAKNKAFIRDVFVSAVNAKVLK